MSPRSTLSLCSFDFLSHTSPRRLLFLQGPHIGWVEGGTLYQTTEATVLTHMGVAVQG